MLNKIVLMGRLTRDPELRRTNGGTAVTSFTIAVDRDFKGQNGEKETDFIDCVAWRQTGEFVSKYFQKGSLIVVSGRLQIRNWTDKDGNKRKTAEIVADNVYFGGSKKDNQSEQNGQNSYDPYNPVSKYTSVPYYNPHGSVMGIGVKPAVTDFALLDDDDAQLPF